MTIIRKWSFDLNAKDPKVFNKYPKPPGLKEVQEKEGSAGPGASSQAESAALVTKKKAQAMGLAMSPGKQMAMNAFMLWMSGKNLNIFSISITSSAILGPTMAIMSTGKKFEPFSDKDGKVDLQMPKLIFIAMNLVWLAIGLYKMSNMRLLPTTSADWANYVVWKEYTETSSIPVL